MKQFQRLFQIEREGFVTMAAKLAAVQGSAIVVVRESWGAESALTMGPGKRCLSAGGGREGAGLDPMMKRSGVGPPWRAHAHHS